MVSMVILAPCGKSRQIWRAIYLYVYIYIFFLKYEINDQYDHLTRKPANSTRYSWSKFQNHPPKGDHDDQNKQKIFAFTKIVID